MSIRRFTLKKRLLFTTVFLAVAPLLLITILDLYMMKQNFTESDKKEISQVAHFLEQNLNLTFKDILSEYNASNLPKNEQVKILNRELQPVIDKITKSFPGIGAGYYSRELDCVVAFGPKPTPEKFITLPEDYPGRQVYVTGKPVYYEISPSIGRAEPLLAYNFPIYRNGELIGHSWGNILLNDLTLTFWDANTYKLTAMVVVLLFGLLWAKRINNHVSKSLNYFTTKVLNPHLGPPLKDTVFAELLPVYASVRRARRALMDEKKLLETLLDTTDAGIVCVDKEGDIILYNRALESMFMRDFSPYRDKPLNDLLNDLEFQPDTCPVSISLESKENIHNMLIPRTTKEGLKWITANSSILQDSTGNFTGVLGTFHDITKIKEYENQAIDVERFKVVGELAAAISHEVRNPLTTVKGFLQLFLRRNDLESADIDHYQLMIDEIDRANSIIGDFLSISRQQQKNDENLCINSVLKDLLLLYESQAVLNDIRIISEFSPAPQISGDKGQLKQVFLNLFNNAVDAMPGGGTLSVKTWFDNAGDAVKINIKDSGTGIPAEVLDRLGKPFVTTKEKGTGLGLSICYRIIENHFGQLSVSTEPDSGTEFTITLPAVNPYLAIESAPITKSGYSEIFNLKQ